MNATEESALRLAGERALQAKGAAKILRWKGAGCAGDEEEGP